MPPLMHLGLANAACAAVLAVLALAVGRWGRRPALTHCVWLLVLIKLVTPPLFPLPLAWLPAAPEPETTQTAAAPEPQPIPQSFALEPERVGPPVPGDVWVEMEKARAKAAIVPPRRADEAAMEEQSEPPVSVVIAPPDLPAAAFTPRAETLPVVTPNHVDTTTSVATILGGAWLVGSVLWFARAVQRLARFQRLLRHARPAPEHVRVLAARLAQQLGLRRCPDVSLLPAPLPPMVWAALGRVRVLLPERLLQRLDQDQLAALLAHELAHVRRGDHWVRRLEFITLGLFWWYPLAWWARTRLQAEEEECCDAWVVEELPARAYASAIVETVDFLSADLAAVPALASGLGRTAGLKRRLTLILSGTAPKRLNIAGRLAVLGLALGLLPLLPTLGRSEKKADVPTPGANTPGSPDVKVEPKDPSNEAIAFQPTPLTLTGGENEVAALNVSKDGRYLAAGTGTANRSGDVRVWTVADHKEVLVYATSLGVASVAFSPDNRFLASSGYDGQAVIREFPSGKIVAVLPLSGPARLAYSPDGKSLITTAENKTIKVWNTANYSEIARIPNDTIFCYCIAWSPDGKYVAVGGGDLGGQGAPNQVTIFDAKTFKEAGKLLGHNGPVMCVAFSPDSKTIGTGGEEGIAGLWQTDGFKSLGTLAGHEARVKAIAFTPDGKTLVTGSHDGTVRLWDVAKQVPITRLDGHVAPTRSVAVSPDGKLIFSGGAQRMLKVWDAKTHQEKAGYQLAPERPGEGSIVLAMRYSPDGKTLATTHEDGTISLRRAANGDLRKTLEGHEEAATCLVFSKDGKTLLTGSSDQTIRLWDVETGKMRATLKGHTSWVYALALSPNGKTLASAGYDKTIRLWDLETMKETAKLTGHKGAIRALAFSPDGNTLASGSGDHTIKLWDLGTLKEKAALTGHQGTVLTLTYSPDGQTLVSGSEDGAVREWEASGKMGLTIVHGSKVNAVSFSPQGRYLVIAGMDARVRFCEAQTGQTVQLLRGNNDAVTCVAWTPDGRFLVTAGYEKSIKLYIVTTGPLRMLTGHTGPVQMASFSPDGKYVLSCSALPVGDKTMRLWDVQTGKEIRKFEGHTGPIGCAVFSPDGKRALSGSHDKTVRLWDVETGNLIRTFEGHEQEVPRVVFSPDGQTGGVGQPRQDGADLEPGNRRMPARPEGPRQPRARPGLHAGRQTHHLGRRRGRRPDMERGKRKGDSANRDGEGPRQLPGRLARR